MRRVPRPDVARVVDLGASPGGWTAVLCLLLQCQRVYAVDRAELAHHLMRNANITFVKADAFAYQPEWLSDSKGALKQAIPDTWMVSDIIAYPQRIVELLDKWCEGRWAEFMVVTMKFQGDIAWDDLELAVATVKRHGYSCRVKHFFNNKNEQCKTQQK